MSTPYHLGVYALIHHQGTFLLARRRHLTSLPHGDYSLPGLDLHGVTGQNIVELAVRRTLLEQLGLSVGELLLVGSHAARFQGGESGPGELKLNLIFGAAYNSGVPTPQPDVIQSLQWMPLVQARSEPGFPAWLLEAMHSYIRLLPQDEPPREVGRRRLIRGRRTG